MPRVRRGGWSLAVTLALAAALTWQVATHRPPTDPVTEIGSQIRCPVCQGVPIADSPTPMARDMMLTLEEALAAGATREEAIAAVLGAYPGSLLLEPRLGADTVALWLVPALAVVGGIGLALTVRRSRAGSGEAETTAELERRLAAARADLEELSVQVAGGDIETAVADHLRRAYLAEIAELEAARREGGRAAAPPLPRSPRRVAVGAAVVVGSLMAVVAAAGAFLVERPTAVSGVAGALSGDPDDFSNETLAAVIAANADHPQIDGMRLALAERYFAAADYSAAFPYYLEIARSPNASDTQAATALTRLGWMAFDGNGEVDTALALLAEAEALVPADPFPRYLEGIVRWCGQGDAAAAARLFRQVLDGDIGDQAVRARVEADLAAAAAGKECER